MTNWYTSDWHFKHNNIIKHCKRPFENTQDMDNTIIKNLVACVNNNDNLFFLGDAALYGTNKIYELLEQIPGKKHLIIGNHDTKKTRKWKGWESVNHYLEITDNEYKIVLCHYPIYSWHNKGKGSLHFHGHCHNTLDHVQIFGQKAKIADVGVDSWNFKPVTVDTVVGSLVQR